VFSLAVLSSLMLSNILAYSAHSKVTEEIKCCKYGPW
jgi:hypothetical protein